MPRLSKIGAAALAAFGWTGLNTVSASYLVVAGGGGGGKRIAGGGGAGGYRTGTTSLNPLLSYAVTVGAGGAGGAVYTVAGTSGNNSVFNDITSAGGGGGAGSSISNGVSGGSGGGSSDGGTVGSGNTPSTSPSQGNNGGVGSGTASAYGGGGGGGASAVGGNGSSTVAGNGGAGTASSISGSSVTYAGGGGGGSNGGTAGTGGSGGGGAGTTSDSTATAGTANLGGGGGGCGGLSTSSGTTFGGQGGSGVVIISYVGAQQFGGGVVTSSGGNTIHTFNTSGTLSPLSSLTASALVVAGGGGGGFDRAGGGGAGGFRTGSGITIDTNSIYLVTVGAGGSGSSSGANKGSSGSDSVFLSITSTGGGGGGSGSNAVGANGGSGGGSRDTSSGGAGSGNTPSTSPSQGNNGGSFGDGSSTTGTGGGGGGAGAVGSAGKTVGTGIGGAGTASSISGSSVTYAGGGGGGGSSGAGGSAGGLGGGGAGGNQNSAGTAGTANLGGGGGGGGDTSGTGGTGGSGVVIISYPGSTQQMAGGTVTVSGGNVIHTFTSSGYLAPIYSANNSLRFRSNASAYLNRTPPVASNRQTWTWSGWIKRGSLGSWQIFFGAWDGAGGNDTTRLDLAFEAADTISITGGVTVFRNSTQVFRDPAAWYHIVVVADTTNATAQNRLRIYVNGVEITSWGTNNTVTQNTSLAVDNSASHVIGARGNSPTQYFDGYMTEVQLIDGQALTPNSFGTSNGLGVWQPIRYGGSYGTNGFYLPFTNTTSTTTLGFDFSPNGNNWTTNNISLTAGSTYDSMTDVPTLTSATTANYCTLNAALQAGGYTLNDGNLNWARTGATGGTNDRSQFGTIGVTSGKWYWEFTAGTVNSNSIPAFGIATGSASTQSWGGSQTGVYIYESDGLKYLSGTGSSYGATFTTGDIIGVAFDADAGTLTFYKNNTSQGQAASGLTSGPYFPAVTRTVGGGGSNGTEIANFGQRPFAYTPPTNFVALNTFNLPTPTIGASASSQADNYFNAVLYTGNGSTNAITGVGFQPDFVWGKSRSNATSNFLYDAVRGVYKRLISDSTAAETDETGGGLSSFNSDGFTVQANSTENGNARTFVAWNWRASNATAVTNTAGSITSTVSANTTAGFSIVTYTGTGANATVGHGLGVAPSMVILKSRSAVTDWRVYSAYLNGGVTPANYTLKLNATNAEAADSTIWNNTVPTSTVFSIGSNVEINNSGNLYVAYCFAPIAGYSAFGSYTGNGSSDGPFIFTGFRPRYVMIKASSTGGAGYDWFIHDTARDTYNACTKDLEANLSLSEDQYGAEQDFLSNGFKLRNTGGGTNQNGVTYIYMAFAESPFKYANARQEKTWHTLLKSKTVQ